MSRHCNHCSKLFKVKKNKDLIIPDEGNKMSFNAKNRFESKCYAKQIHVSHIRKIFLFEKVQNLLLHSNTQLSKEHSYSNRRRFNLAIHA